MSAFSVDQAVLHSLPTGTGRLVDSQEPSRIQINEERLQIGRNSVKSGIDQG